MTDDLPELRASDADRDRVAETLRDALAEGRLDMDEFEERLDLAYRARTHGELAPLVRDLPRGGASAPASAADTGGRWADRIGGTATSRWGIGILGGFNRRGHWVMPRVFTALALMGGGVLDLRSARFEQRETVIRCFAIMGGFSVIASPEIEVDVRGIGIMGGFDDGTPPGRPPEPGAPRVVITGFAFWGGVGVERKLTREERQQLRDDRRHQRRLEREDRRDRLEERRALARERRDRHRALGRERADHHRDPRRGDAYRPYGEKGSGGTD